MIKKGADVNVVGKNGLTPLHVASHYNHSPMVTLLLTSKASPHSTAKVLYPPLSCVCLSVCPLQASIVTLQSLADGHATAEQQG